MVQPEKRFKAGMCSASIFANKVKGGDVFRSVQVQKAYKAADGSYRYTSSFTREDIPRVLFLLRKAYEYLLSAPKADAGKRE
jgi:hypothetical protein